MKISMYELSITGYMWRFFFMMAIVIGAVFSGYMYLAVSASVIFLSMMLGMKIEWNSNKTRKDNVINMRNESVARRKAS